MRGIINSDLSINESIDKNHDLISLEDIIKRQPAEGQQAIESYTMVNRHMKESRDSNCSDDGHDRTLVVKRTNLLFNDKECLVLNFQNITALKLLKNEE